MVTSPLAARRQLGAVLKNIRTTAKRRIRDVAKELGYSDSTISRLENGLLKPRPAVIHGLLQAYGEVSTPYTEEVNQLLKDSLSDDQGISSEFRDALNDGVALGRSMGRYAELEQVARNVSTFQPFLIYGLLQTAEYIDGIARLVFPEQSSTQRARFVEMRLKRQQILRRPPDEFGLSIVLRAQALDFPVIQPEAMRRQLDHLAAQLEGPLRHVDFHVAPKDLVHLGLLGGPFSILEFDSGEDQDLVFEEGRKGATYLESRKDVDFFKEAFASLVHSCLNRRQSIEMVKTVSRALK